MNTETIKELCEELIEASQELYGIEEDSDAILADIISHTEKTRVSAENRKVIKDNTIFSKVDELLTLMQADDVEYIANQLKEALQEVSDAEGSEMSHSFNDDQKITDQDDESEDNNEYDDKNDHDSLEQKDDEEAIEEEIEEDTENDLLNDEHEFNDDLETNLPKKITGTDKGGSSKVDDIFIDIMGRVNDWSEDIKADEEADRIDDEIDNLIDDILYDDGPRAAELAEVTDEDRDKLLKYVSSKDVRFMNDNEIIRLAVDFIEYAEVDKNVDRLNQDQKDRIFGDDLIHGCNPAIIATATDLDFLGVFNLLYDIKNNAKSAKQKLSTILLDGFSYDPTYEVWDYPEEIRFVIPTPEPQYIRKNTVTNSSLESNNKKSNNQYDKDGYKEDRIAQEKIITQRVSEYTDATFPEVSFIMRTLPQIHDMERLNSVIKSNTAYNRLINMAENTDLHHIFATIQCQSPSLAQDAARFITDKFEKRGIGHVWYSMSDLYNLSKLPTEKAIVINAFYEKNEYREHAWQLLSEIYQNEFVIVIGRKREIVNFLKNVAIKYIFKTGITLYEDNADAFLAYYLNALPESIRKDIGEKEKKQIIGFFTLANPDFAIAGKDLAILAAVRAIEAGKFIVPEQPPDSNN